MRENSASGVRGLPPSRAAMLASRPAFLATCDRPAGVGETAGFASSKLKQWLLGISLFLLEVADMIFNQHLCSPQCLLSIPACCNLNVISGKCLYSFFFKFSQSFYGSVQFLFVICIFIGFHTFAVRLLSQA